MSLKEEMQVYNAAPVSLITGETESYDNKFFPNVIRKKELELIQPLLKKTQPKLILDYGCGGGWLSLLFQKWGFASVGIDISKNMVKTAKIVCHTSEFILCDAMKLPFIEDTFDMVVGISILHHLDFEKATLELKRISLSSCTFLFMEPSSLNPLSAFGRKVFPMEAHTDGEKPFTPENFQKLLNFAEFEITKYFTNFFLSFPVARLAKSTGLNPPRFLVALTYYLENFVETMPFIRYLNSNIVAIARIG